MNLTLNEPQRRWEFRDGARLLLTFSHDGYQYATDRGEPLGREWTGALKKAEELAKGRMR